MIDANTKTLGVMGDPVRHSLSPLLHGFILKELGLNYCYHAFQVRLKDLRSAIEGIRALGFVGVNVTIPHKEAVIPFLDEISQEAKEIGAVNTILNQEGRLIGFDTDSHGFQRSLLSFKDQLCGERAVVLGAGGGAKAVVYSLIQLGVGEIAIYNRTIEKGLSLAARVQEQTRFQSLSAYSLDDPSLQRNLRQARLLVNATPVGMFPHIRSTPLKLTTPFHSDLMVYDLIYNPPETALLKLAKASGAQTMNGLDMLIFQGIQSLKIWTGQEIGENETFIEKLKEYLTAKLMQHE